MANTYFASDLFTATVRNQFNRILPQMLGTGRLTDKLNTLETNIQSFEAAVIAEFTGTGYGIIQLPMGSWKVATTGATLSTYSAAGGSEASGSSAQNTNKQTTITAEKTAGDLLISQTVAAPPDLDGTAAMSLVLYASEAGTADGVLDAFVYPVATGALGNTSDLVSTAAQNLANNIAAYTFAIGASTAPLFSVVVSINESTNDCIFWGGKILYTRKRISTWS